MNRRDFLRAAPLACAPAALPFQEEKSKLKITGVRLVQPRRVRPLEPYKPPPGARLELGGAGATPMSIYPDFKPARGRTGLGDFTVEISTDKGVKGYGRGGPAGGPIVENHLAGLLLGQDPFNVERIWDIMWRSTISYDWKGVALHAISGVDLALWDLIGNATGLPVYKLLGGAVRSQVPCYATGNDVEVYAKMGFRKVKAAWPLPPSAGRNGMRKNVDLIRRTREILGPDGEIMLDCWMGLTENYTLELVQMMAPYRLYWIEEALPPYDYAGYARLKAKLKPVLVTTGEHEYGRQGFRQLLEHNSADIWQPDVHWGGGGMTEMRRIAAFASVYDIPVIPHGGGARDSIHFAMATVNCPLAEMFMPVPTQQYAEENLISQGPEGVYTQASDKPGFGWDFIMS